MDPATVAPPERAAFTGTGGEYFRIWAVNLSLSIVTFGIYSAWAKVRREQYFHGNTRLAGASFGYHAQPMAILRGRLIAVGALVALQVSGLLSALLNWAMVILLFVATPWVIVRALRFRLHNTSHRGIRFRFHGTMSEAALAYLGLPFLVVLTLGALAPFALHRQAQFRIAGAAFGTTRFGFAARAGAFYRIVGTTALLAVAILAAGVAPIVAFLAQHGWKLEPGVAPPGWTIFAAAAAYLVVILIVGPLFQVRMQNLVWNGITLGPHRFASDQRFASFLQLQLVNAIATIATLGLFRPFAVVRIARYRAEHLTLVPGASLDTFLADAAAGASATGEEFADLFDFDIGF